MCIGNIISSSYVYFKFAGGLGFTLHNIGTSLGIVGIAMIPISLLAFNPVSDYNLHIRSYVLCPHLHCS